jgi:hypothetical protein
VGDAKHTLCLRMHRDTVEVGVEEAEDGLKEKVAISMMM